MNPISNQRNSKYKLSDYIGGKANIYPFTSSQNMYFAKNFQCSHLGTFMLIAMQIPWAFSI